MYSSATLMRRDALETIGGFDDSLDIYEDWDLYLRLSLVGELRYVDVAHGPVPRVAGERARGTGPPPG